MAQRPELEEQARSDSSAPADPADDLSPPGDTEAPAEAQPTGTEGWTVRRGSKQVTRFIADGTGRSEAEVQVLIVAGAVPLLVATGIAATRGVFRLIDFLIDG